MSLLSFRSVCINVLLNSGIGAEFFMTCTFGIGMLYSDISLFTYVQVVVYFLNAAFQFYTSKVIRPVRRGSCAYFGGGGPKLECYGTVWQELFSFSSCSIRLQSVSGHSFLPGNDAADELAGRGALLVPSAIPCSLSSHISHIHSFLFLGWRHTVSSKFFDTQVPSTSTEELALPRHARCVLSRPRCN